MALLLPLQLGAVIEAAKETMTGWAPALPALKSDLSIQTPVRTKGGRSSPSPDALLAEICRDPRPDQPSVATSYYLHVPEQFPRELEIGFRIGF